MTESLYEIMHQKITYRLPERPAVREISAYVDAAVSAAIKAGYRKPRIITTAEELDALPEGTTIVDQAERLTLEETSIQCLEWVDRHGNACHVELPATVLEEAAS